MSIAPCCNNVTPAGLPLVQWRVSRIPIFGLW